MKKLNLLVSTITLTSALVMTGTTTFAASVSDTTSKNSVKMIAGDDEINPPVNPIDPEKPIDPNEPIDPTDPENPGTGNEGALTVDYVSNIKFGDKKIAGKDMIYNGLNENPFVQVSDVRGTGAGWNLSASMDEFKSLDGKKVLKGASLSLINGEVKAGSVGNLSPKPTTSDILFDNSDVKNVLTAKKDAGKGTFVSVWSGEKDNNSKVQLKVLAGTAEVDTEYTSTLTWQLADAPK